MNEEQGRKGKLFVFSGPSGVGKGTLRMRALSGVPNLVYSISCTTRAPRTGERDGLDYWFISKQDFEDKVARGLFLEYAFVHGDFYGTLRENIRRETEAGHDVMLEIDVQGALQIRELLPESILIFVQPPSLKVLEERLRLRGTESEDKITQRLENAKQEMRQASKYDHVIVNDTLEQAAEELRDVIISYRSK